MVKVCPQLHIMDRYGEKNSVEHIHKKFCEILNLTPGVIVLFNGQLVV